MKEMSVIEAAQIMKGKIQGRTDGIITGICVDSREAREGSLFFALKGETTDGHRYVPMAYENGAVAAVTSSAGTVADNCPICRIVVEDTFKALQDLARAYRNRFDIPFVGVTGSSGKTTTKDLIASVLSQKYNTHKTIGNQNSTTGVPLTIFNLKDENEISVMEISMDAPGEILGNAEIVRPNTAVMTNIGMCHIEFLKTRDAIFKAKSEILTYLTDKDAAIVNADDDKLATIASDTYKVIRVGIDNGEKKAYDIEQTADGVAFRTVFNGQEAGFRFRLPGLHNVTNCMLAIAVAERYGLTAEMVQAGFDAFESSNNRMKEIEYDGLTLIDDSYNANPDSMRASFDFLSHKAKGRKVAVVGDMLELGDYSSLLHEQVGEAASRYGIEVVLYCGSFGNDFLRGYNKSAAGGECHIFGDSASLSENIGRYLKEGDTVIFKASHAVGLDKVFKEFIGR